MRNNYHITMESFGAECPMNWQEIANFLNDKIDELVEETDSEYELQYRLRRLWDDYCDGKINGAPIPSDEPWSDDND